MLKRYLSVAIAIVMTMALTIPALAITFEDYIRLEDTSYNKTIIFRAYCTPYASGGTVTYTNSWASVQVGNKPPLYDEVGIVTRSFVEYRPNKYHYNTVRQYASALYQRLGFLKLDDVHTTNHNMGYFSPLPSGSVPETVGTVAEYYYNCQSSGYPSVYLVAQIIPSGSYRQAASGN